MSTMKTSEPLVLVSKQNGLVVIPATPLTRLNYFDGKFLRAQDLQLEQKYLRNLVRHSNQAGGPGVAHGYDLTLGSGDTLNVGDGLAIDPQGRVLLLPQTVSVNIQDLIEKSRDVQQMFGRAGARNAEFEECVIRSEDPPIEVHQAGDLFLIVISSAEAYCGEEDVYGRLCEEACATSTDRPYIMEGVTIRAIPLVLRSPLPNSRARSLTQVHYRSRVASAYFEDERKRVASLISKFGLEQQTWCLGADAAGGNGVAIGVIARAGSNTVFLDAWIARRERIDPPAKRYWQWRMMMRPWDVFIAQVLQFQCQLRDLFRTTPPGRDDDPCGGARGVIHEAANTMADFRKFYEVAAERFAALRINLDEVMTFRGGLTRMTALNDKLFTVGRELSAIPRDEFLIRGGIVELPSAGYLPVTPSANATINQQVRFLMGNGVDLRFCVVRPDYVAHALEEAQHMERISLLQGLDDPKNKPEVDILVPNGEIIEQKQLSSGTGLEAKVEVSGSILTGRSSPIAGPATPANVLFVGAARAEKLASNGGAFYLSCEHRTILKQQDQPTIVAPPPPGTGQPGLVGNINTGIPPAANIRLDSILISRGIPTGGLWVSLRCDNDVFKLNRGDHANFNARAIVSAAANRTPVLDVEFNGVLQIVAEAAAVGMHQVVRGRIENAQLTVLSEAVGVGTRQTSLVDLDVTIEMRAQSQITILLDHAQNDLVLSARWDKQPLEINASIIHKRSASGTVPQNVPLAEAVLTENADVLSATNASHVQALAGLRVVAATLSDPNFADAKARLLFPPPPKPIDEVLVRGTMDWVLFHRRRTKKCQIDVAPPPPAPPPRRYALWMGVAADEAAVKEAEAALVNNRPFNVEKIFFRRVDNIEFQSGLGTMISRPDDIEADWKQNDPGQKILVSAIASATANDGEPVAKDRIGKVEQAVAPISKVNGTARHVLSTVHQELAVAGTDGIIVMITLRDVATVCHRVFAAEAQAIERVMPLLVQGKIQEAISDAQLVPLGVALFKPETAEPAANSGLPAIKAKWDADVRGTPGQMIVFTAPIGHTVATIPLAQARAIRQTIGTSTEQVIHQETPVLPKPPIECPVFSIIVRPRTQPPPPPPTRIARLLVQTQVVGGNRVFGATSSPLAVKFNPDSTLAEGLSTAIISQIQPHIPNRIHAVELAPQPAGEPNAGKRLDAIITELGAKNLLVPAGANKKVVALQAAEQPLLNAGGVTADDVIFLIATAAQVQTRTALVIFATVDAPAFFPRREPELRARVVFLDNAPEGTALRELVRKQPTNTKVRAIHLAALIPPPAAGSDQRNRVVLDEVRTNGFLSMTQGPTVGVLAQADRDRLLPLDPGILNGINEVIFLVLEN